MAEPSSPPLPAVPALTLAAADQWRAARVWRRVEGRWLVLLPLLTMLLAVVVDDLPTSCERLDGCAVPFGEGIAAALLWAEALVLLVRPRGSFAVPAAVGALVWWLPDALPGAGVRWAALVAHLAVAGALYRVAAGRRQARAQLVALMGPPVPYPWTLLGHGSPVEPPPRPVVRRVLAALLGAAAVLLVVSGVSATADSNERAQAADEVRATVRAVHDDGASVTVDYRMPTGTGDFSAEIDVWWDWVPKVGDDLPLLADGTGWYRVTGEVYDPTPWWVLAGLAACCAGLLLASAHRTDLARHAPVDEAPAMRVRIRQDPGGGLVVLPVDGGDKERPLWRLAFRRDVASFEPADEDGPAEWMPDGRPQEAEELRAATPAEAAALLERATAPVEALLYQGPDGAQRQLVVYRAPEDPETWQADSAAAFAAPPRLRRDAGAVRNESALAVPAAAAETLERDLARPAALPPGARVYGLPAGLRWAAGPVTAGLLVGAVLLLDDGGAVEGLVRPLAVGLPFLLAVISACSWQLAVDRDGVALSGALWVERLPWQRVAAAAVHRGRFTVQAPDGRQIGFGSRPATVLHRHFGGSWDPRQVARTVTLMAHSAEHRPPTLLPADAVGRVAGLNRLVVAGYLAWVLGRWFLG
ncbi:hypothetical protein [Streptomyces sp. TLI_171]|uniref:hypothetical protein n=1 Tax=Streptomyces sp. TLI_171 TaxID=1938859 RepID=UPI000C62DBD4|nr:hypothetical protein [Streptomyces sp. TLI_171]RKE19359.1 hypothetical protein BX266_2681 [Streptomyces sp. TLI_171]